MSRKPDAPTNRTRWSSGMGLNPECGGFIQCSVKHLSRTFCDAAPTNISILVSVQRNLKLRNITLSLCLSLRFLKTGFENFCILVENSLVLSRRANLTHALKSFNRISACFRIGTDSISVTVYIHTCLLERFKKTFPASWTRRVLTSLYPSISAVNEYHSTSLAWKSVIRRPEGFTLR